MESLYKLLYKIKVKPALFFGVQYPSLERLNEFIGGYTFRQAEIDSRPCDEYFYNGFREFVAQKYKITLSRSWRSIIDFHSVSADDAWETFYKLLDEYLGEKKSLYTE